MNMAVKVSLEVLESGEEGSIARTSAFGEIVIIGKRSHMPQPLTVGVVFGHQHPDRIFDRSEMGCGGGQVSVHGLVCLH
ncbi:hypothetical protein BH20ACI2_BH20ACI2_25130 [soil metagenome]